MTDRPFADVFYGWKIPESEEKKKLMYDKYPNWQDLPKPLMNGSRGYSR
jgi:hypothetical protein